MSPFFVFTLFSVSFFLYIFVVMEYNWSGNAFPTSCGFVQIASVTPEIRIANPLFNIESILKELANERLAAAQFIVLPELCITGYSCGDLFFQSSLLKAALDALQIFCQRTRDDSRLIALGLPLHREGSLYNCAAVVAGGRILGIVPKTHIPNYQEFYEKRWFKSGVNLRNDTITIGEENIPFGTNLLFSHNGATVGVEICEDLWVPVPPSSYLCMNGAEIILNLSATDDNIGKYEYIKSLVSSQSGRCRCAYAYASAGRGESSTDLVFSGINLIAADGKILNESPRFELHDSFTVAAVDIEKLRNDRRKYSTFYQDCNFNSQDVKIVSSGFLEDNDEIPLHHVDAHPFVPSNEKKRSENCHEIINIQSWGLSQRLAITNSKHLIIGISGGLDSTLSLLIAHFTFRKLGLDTRGIIGVTMPAFATSDRTHNNAVNLMEILNVTALEIPVNEAVLQHFKDIGHDPGVFDAVYENSFARERTQILMDLANKYNGLVLGTGDMSELALGWCTYNGDQMSMYNVNAGVPKTLVRYLVSWFADNSDSPLLKATLKDIIDTPISPELVPASSKQEIDQKTEDLIGPYELHDFFLYHVLRNGFSPKKILQLAVIAFQRVYEREVIKKWLLNFYKRFFSQQFKRSCMPDGPKIGSVCLSPRGDWRMPSDADAALWIEEIERL